MTQTKQAQADGKQYDPAFMNSGIEKHFQYNANIYKILYALNKNPDTGAGFAIGMTFLPFVNFI
jgi:hypothetical protein